eukprot:TRINITY_DN16893_c0_g1_i2.p1 TRINITY_DN16893_c0_g1~~TRINITY_DN16893_c0_g1_i2.p1  ORF type:complete len:197 (+),score=21.23 TRINITY_DN16893_c0_g1_i2:143-733(+)
MADVDVDDDYLEQERGTPLLDDAEKQASTLPDQEVLKRAKTIQLLCMGAWLGIGGLFLSWMILLFNSNCSTKYIKGQYTTYAGGNRTMCKESMKHHTVQSANERTGGMVVPVPYITCKHSGECASIAGGYCAGGPWVGARRDEELDEEGYCKDNVCNCKQYLYDCGTTPCPRLQGAAVLLTSPGRELTHSVAYLVW